MAQGNKGKTPQTKDARTQTPESDCHDSGLHAHSDDKKSSSAEKGGFPAPNASKLPPRGRPKPTSTGSSVPTKKTAKKPATSSLPCGTPSSSTPPYHHSHSTEEDTLGRSRVYQQPTKPRSHSFHFPLRSNFEPVVHLPKREHCPSDILEYRSGYPALKDDSKMTDNYDFYSGNIRFKPKGVYIDDILSNWKGKYDVLEYRHDYIQWLFPTQDDSGTNYFAQALQKHEIVKICADPEAFGRVLKSYNLMLDFYGMKLNKETGEVERSDGHWRERFSHLNTSTHNCMRITRILKCLGELSYEHLKAPFVRFILIEAIKTRYLKNTLDSCMKYWVETIRDEHERDSLWLLAEELVQQISTKRR